MEEASKIAYSIGNRAVRLPDDGYTPPRPRRITNLHPFGGREDWGVHNNSASNLERALVERVLTVKGEGGQQVIPPQPKPGLVKKRLKEFRRRLLHRTPITAPLSTEEFVDGYVGRKRKVYECAAASLESSPLEPKDAYIQAFIKDEKTNLTRKDDPCPRIIQPRSSRFNVAIGKHLRPMEKHLYRGIARVYGSTTVMKGLNASQRGKQISRKWRRFDNPVAVMLDASRFDQHCNRDIIAWEHGIEERLTTDPADLRRLNRWRRENVCFARAEGAAFKYTLLGTRMSGDMDTALGNCLTMCAMMWSFVTELKLKRFEFANDGDDGVLFVERGDLEVVLENYHQYFLELGFTMKLEGVAHVLEGIEFCQAHPVFDGTSYRMVRDPRVCVDKDSLTLKNSNDPTELMELRDAIGQCGLALAGDMPIFRSFYRSFLSSGVRSRAFDTRAYSTGMEFLAHGMEVQDLVSPIPDEVRHSFHLAFGLLPDTQLAIEEELDRTNTTLHLPAVQVTTFSTSTNTELTTS